MAASSVPVLRHFTGDSVRGFPDVVARLTRGRTSSTVNALGWTLFAVELAILAGQLFKGVDPQDEGQFLTYPWLIAQGRMPYRDIWMSYPPAMYLVLVPFFKAGMAGLVVERGIGLGARVLYVLLINRVITRTWTRFSWLGVPVTFSLVFIASDTKPYPWLVAMPILVLGLVVAQERPMVSALLFFVAGTFRFEFGVAGFVALAALAVLDRAGWRRYCRAAAALAAALSAFYLALNLATEGWAFRDIFLDQVVNVQRGRYLSLRALPYGPLGLPVLAVMLAGPPILIVIGLLGRRPHLVATNLAVLVLIPHFVQRADASHLFSMASLAIPWAVVTLAALLRSGEETGAGSSRRPGTVTVALALAWIGVTVGAWCFLLVLGYAVYLSPLSPLASPPPSQLAQRVVSGQHTILASDLVEAHDDRQVTTFFGRHASTHQKVYIVPKSLTSAYTRTDLYYVLGLQPASRYMEIQPGVEDQLAVQRQIERDLRDCSWVVLVQGGPWYGPTADWRSYRPPLQEFIGSHFHPVLQNFTYAVLERNAPSA